MDHFAGPCRCGYLGFLECDSPACVKCDTMRLPLGWRFVIAKSQKETVYDWIVYVLLLQVFMPVVEAKVAGVSYGLSSLIMLIMSSKSSKNGYVFLR